MTWSKAFWITIAVIVALIVIVKYNNITTYDEKVVDAWKPLQSALKIRYDSIPRLIPAITLYAGQNVPEAQELANVLPAFASAKTIEDQTTAANTIEDRLQKMYQFVADRYPGILENNQIMAIRTTMKQSVEQVMPAMEVYNKAAEGYNEYIRRFPSNIIAAPLGFAKRYGYIQPQT